MKSFVPSLCVLLFFIINPAKSEENVRFFYPFQYLVPILKTSFESQEKLQLQYDILKKDFDKLLYQFELKIKNENYLFYFYKPIPVADGGVREIDIWKLNQENKRWELFFTGLFPYLFSGEIIFNEESSSILLKERGNNSFKGATILSFSTNNSKDLENKKLNIEDMDLIVIDPLFKKQSLKEILEKYNTHLKNLKKKAPLAVGLDLKINKFEATPRSQKIYYIFILYPIFKNNKIRYKLDGWNSIKKEEYYDLDFTYYINPIIDPDLIYDQDRKILKLIDLADSQEKMNYLFEAPKKNRDEVSPSNNKKK